MKKLNTKVSKKIAAIVLTSVATFSLMGCHVSSTSTYTETTTDADGNTTTTTTTTTDGKTTTETYEGAPEEEVEKTVATIAFDNQTDFDFAELYFSSTNSDNWGGNVLGDDPLEAGMVATFDDKFTYSSDNTVWDIKAVDADGTYIEVGGIDMTEAFDPENIYITIVYDEESDLYSATIE